MSQQFQLFCPVCFRILTEEAHSSHLGQSEKDGRLDTIARAPPAGPGKNTEEKLQLPTFPWKGKRADHASNAPTFMEAAQRTDPAYLRVLMEASKL